MNAKARQEIIVGNSQAWKAIKELSSIVEEMPDDRLTVKLAARASLDRLWEAMNRINTHLGYLPPPDEPKGGA